MFWICTQHVLSLELWLKKAILDQPTLSLDPDLSYDTFLGQSDDHIGSILPKTSFEADAKVNESHDSQVPAKGRSDSSFLYVPNEDMSGQKVSSVNTPTEGFPVLSTEQLIIEQNKDSELSVLISKTLSEDEMSKTKSGNQYLLTIMCTSTRFPEAVPLRNIKAKTIIKALMIFFTLVGVPKSVQSD
jgi:hypothetical protein